MKNFCINLFLWLGILSSLVYGGLLLLGARLGGFNERYLIILLSVYFINICVLTGIYFKPKNYLFLLIGFFYSIFLALMMLKNGISELENSQIFNFSITEPFVNGLKVLLRPVFNIRSLDGVWCLYIAGIHFFYGIIFLFLILSFLRKQKLIN